MGERLTSCVGSGFCCKKAPCFFGQSDGVTPGCVHLVPWLGDTLAVPRYRCGIYEIIRRQPGAELSPAFGAGCSSPLFNVDRERVLVALSRRRPEP